MNTLYAKYNSFRKPEFQVSTKIVEDQNGKRYALKEPMCEGAKAHIQNMKMNYELLSKEELGYDVLPYEEMGEGIAFSFVDGKGLLQVISENKDVTSMMEEAKKWLDVILPLNQNLMLPFETSVQFEEMFPFCKLQKDELCYPISNLDVNFDNFVLQGEKLICIDYEWVCSFLIPTRFLRFRTCLYLFQKRADYILSFMGREDFLRSFGFSNDDIDLFMAMDDCFQQYVHGLNRKYIYNTRYMKKTTTLEELQEAQKALCVIPEKDALISKQQEQIDALNEYIHHIRNLKSNPKYAAKFIAKRAAKKCLPKPVADKLRSIRSKRNYVNNAVNDEAFYQEWIEELEEQDCLENQRISLQYRPKISVLVPVYNVLDRHLEACIDSVINQTYDNWELCLADDCSTWDNVRTTLGKYDNHEKIKVVYREENGHISECTNSALEVATGEYIAFLDCDDLLAPNALFEMVKALNKDETLDFIYSDEDKIDDAGERRHQPHFKPDWSPDTFMSVMYTCHLALYRKSIVDEIGGLRSEYNGAQDYDFTLRFTEKTSRIGHIPKILYHWRERPESTADSPEAKPYIKNATIKAKEDALKRRGLEGTIEFVPTAYQYRVNYLPKEDTLVSIIIPSKDNFDILNQCIASLYGKTAYRNFEVIVVDNGSNEDNKAKYQALADQYHFAYHHEKMDFNFSHMCNWGASFAKGNVLLFLNDDIEIIETVWLERMVGHALVPGTGAVGAKLLYPKTDLIQHAGVVSLKNGPVHAFGGFSDAPVYYFGRNKIDYNFSSVTGACLMVARDKFNQVGGFEEGLPVAYNDIDLCFKLVESGYFNVLRNDAILYHHESISRGDDRNNAEKFNRLMRERDKLYQRHPQFLGKDAFYSENLTQIKADFSLNYEKSHNFQSEPEEKVIPYVKDNTVSASIDILDVNHFVCVEGWAFSSDTKENVKLYLFDGTRGYLLKTGRVNRPDVVNNVRRKLTRSDVGFRTEFLRKSIPSGRYDIYVVIDDTKMLKMDKVLQF